MANYRFVYSSVIDSSDRMLENLLELMKKYQVESRLAHRLTFAVSEAVNNALLHGNALNPSKSIIVKLKLNESHISADIIDQGKGGLEQIVLRKPASLLAENGRGIGFMKHFADMALFTCEPDGGLHVTLTFDRKINIEVNNS